MKHRVLWIEDGAFVHFAELVGPVFISGRYDLVVALNVTEALEIIFRDAFDALVVDIRIPPGELREWVELYQEAGKIEARLGLELLKSLLGSNDARIQISSRPSWLRPERVAIFTVESWHEVEKDIDSLGVKVFQEKNALVSRRMLIDLIDKVLSTPLRGNQ